MLTLIVTLFIAQAVLLAGVVLLVRIEAKRELTALRALLMAVAHRSEDTGPPMFQPIQELPDMTAQDRLVFYQSVLGWSGWKRLAHVLQAETRSSLNLAKTAAQANNQVEALLRLGAAWTTANMAVMPEARAWEALQAVKAQQLEDQITKASGNSGGRVNAGSSGRPPWEHVR